MSRTPSTIEPLPIYGQGTAVRDYLYVDDHCAAIALVLHDGAAGQVYNVGANEEVNTVELATRILDLLGKPQTLMQHVGDRPGHDYRYSMDSSRLHALGWQRRYDLDATVAATVRWYEDPRELVATDQVRRLPRILPPQLRPQDGRHSTADRAVIGQERRAELLVFYLAHAPDIGTILVFALSQSGSWVTTRDASTGLADGDRHQSAPVRQQT